MLNFIKATTLLVLLSFLLFIGNLYSQTNEDCYGCHSDKSLTKSTKGKSVSLFVNSNVIGNSIHKSLKCVSCHPGANVTDFPHPEN